MEDVGKEPEVRKINLQDLLFFVEKFDGNNTGVGHVVSSREQQENNARTNQLEQETLLDIIYDDGTAQQQRNQYEVGKADTGR